MFAYWSSLDCSDLSKPAVSTMTRCVQYTYALRLQWDHKSTSYSGTLQQTARSRSDEEKDPCTKIHRALPTLHIMRTTDSIIITKYLADTLVDPKGQHCTTRARDACWRCRPSVDSQRRPLTSAEQPRLLCLIPSRFQYHVFPVTEKDAPTLVLASLISCKEKNRDQSHIRQSITG